MARRSRRAATTSLREPRLSKGRPLEILAGTRLANRLRPSRSSARPPMQRSAPGGAPFPALRAPPARRQGRPSIGRSDPPARRFPRGPSKQDRPHLGHFDHAARSPAPATRRSAAFDRDRADPPRDARRRRSRRRREGRACPSSRQIVTSSQPSQPAESRMSQAGIRAGAPPAERRALPRRSVRCYRGALSKQRDPKESSCPSIRTPSAASRISRASP